MSVLLWIIGATFVNSLVALVGAFTLGLRQRYLDTILHALVGFSAGALLAGAFFHLIAESLEKLPAMDSFYFVFAGFILFFVMERFLHWRHCHEGKCEVHAFSYLVLVGDAIHNFVDGLIIAGSFVVDAGVGIVTTLVVISHELPQELGNFAVLVYGGVGKKKALLYNFLAQLTSIAGGILGFFLVSGGGIAVYLLPFAAGGFIYIAASDLVPELHKQASVKKTVSQFAFFLMGIGFMIATKLLLAA